MKCKTCKHGEEEKRGRGGVWIRCQTAPHIYVWVPDNEVHKDYRCGGYEKGE